MIDNEQVVAEQEPSQEQVTPSAPQEIAPAPAPEDRTAVNMRRLREKAERVERERDELARRLQEAESKSQPPAARDDDDINIAPDELAEGKHLSKVAQKIKRLETELKQYRQQSTAETAEARLKSQYSDFDKVVSRDNVEALREAYPEIAESIHANPDIYKRAVSAYTIIKKMGIYQDEQQFAEDRALVQKNAAKPKPMASLSPQQGDSPLSQANAFANGLTAELKAQLWKQNMEARKRV